MTLLRTVTGALVLTFVNGQFLPTAESEVEMERRGKDAVSSLHKTAVEARNFHKELTGDLTDEKTTAADYEDKISSTQADNQSISEENTKLAGEIADLQGSIQDTEAEVAAFQQETEGIIRDRNADIANLKQTIENMHSGHKATMENRNEDLSAVQSKLSYAEQFSAELDGNISSLESKLSGEQNAVAESEETCRNTNARGDEDKLRNADTDNMQRTKIGELDVIVRANEDLLSQRSDQSSMLQNDNTRLDGHVNTLGEWAGSHAVLQAEVVFWRGEHVETSERLQKEISDLKAQHKEDISALNEARALVEKQAEASDSDWARQLTEANAAHEARVASLTTDHTSAVEELERQLAECQQRGDTLELEVQRLQAEIVTLGMTHESNIGDLRSQHENVVNGLESAREQERLTHEDNILAYSNRIDELNSNHATALQNMTDTHSSKLGELNALISGHEKTIDGKNTLNARLATANDDMTTRFEQLNKMGVCNTAVKIYDQGGCTKEGANLGTTYSSPQECWQAASANDSCGSAIMWAPGYNYAWGCRCCAPGGEGSEGSSTNANWERYMGVAC